MKKCIAAIVLTFLTSSLFAQFDWTKYEFNQVLQAGPDNFDLLAIGQPTVLFEEGTIKMWYAGVGADMKARLCYATSTDGINWTKHGIVMDVGSEEEWDRGWIDTPEVLKVPGGYYLSYYGDTIQQSSAISSSMGAAFSIDGVEWTKYEENPVFSKGEIGEWDGTWVESAALHWDEENEEYFMWYNGMDTATWQLGIGFATSSDGIQWTKYAGNPIIIPGLWGSVDDMWCGTPAVLYRNDQFEMWYSATQAEDFNAEIGGFDNVSICYAISNDGINWVKYESNPLFDTYTEPHNPDVDLGGPWAADVIYDESNQSYMMWYEAHGGNDDYSFSLATAPVDLSFSQNASHANQIKVFPNPVSDVLYVDAPNVESLSLYDLHGKLIVCKASGYIDVSSLPSGVYVLNIETESSLSTHKVVK